MRLEQVFDPILKGEKAAARAVGAGQSASELTLNASLKWNRGGYDLFQAGRREEIT